MREFIIAFMLLTSYRIQIDYASNLTRTRFVRPQARLLINTLPLMPLFISIAPAALLCLQQPPTTFPYALIIFIFLREISTVADFGIAKVFQSCFAIVVYSLVDGEGGHLGAGGGQLFFVI